MKKSMFKIAGILGLSLVGLNSCNGFVDPPTVYFPDMYFPIAYDPQNSTQLAYTDHENEVPLFQKNGGSNQLSVVEGTVPRTKEGILPYEAYPKTPEEYTPMYDNAKQTITSPLDPSNMEKDLERGKILYERTCSACHGVAGDGQGPIVQSGAYSGVPAYKDRELTIGAVHFVITNGKNAMGSYAGQLSPGDRWRVAMYVMNQFKKDALTASTIPANATTNVSTTSDK